MFSESENVWSVLVVYIGGVGVFWKLQEVCWLNMTKYINLFLSILSLF